MYLDQYKALKIFFLG